MKTLNTKQIAIIAVIAEPARRRHGSSSPGSGSQQNNTTINRKYIMKTLITTFAFAGILAIGSSNALAEAPVQLTEALLEQTLTEVDKAVSDLDAAAILEHFDDKAVISLANIDRPDIPTKSYSKDEYAAIIGRSFSMVESVTLQRISTDYDISPDGQSATVKAQYEKTERLNGSLHGEEKYSISNLSVFHLVEGRPRITKFDLNIALKRETGSLLPLYGKTLMVYPILMGKEGIPDDEGTRKFGIVIAKPAAGLLEEYGVRPDISTEGPNAVSAEDSLDGMEEKFLTFLEGKKVNSDYSLFVRFHAGPSEHGPTMTRICVVLLDADRKVAWSGEQTEFPEEFSPMHALMSVIGTMHFISDLKEPDWDNRKYGPFARRMSQQAGMLSSEDWEAMKERFKAARGSFKEASLTIYPFRIWKQKEGSDEGAVALAEKFNEAGIFKSAIVAEADTGLVAKRDPDNPGQQKIIADSARDFRKYLKEHPPATDYALLVDVTIPVHHIHFVLCGKSGEWLHFDITNSHHEDYRELKPKTVEDCAKLVFQRLESTIQK
jgi:hypothetical protein